MQLSIISDSSLIIKPEKQALVDAIWAKPSLDATGPKGEVQYVLDGGTLLHRIPWPRGFPKYVTGKYGAAVFIFDGYTQSSTKDITPEAN